MDLEKPEYSKSAEYWSKIEPTDDGMLGGLGTLSRLDIQASEKFLKTLFKLPNPPSRSRALDCGAGIGRITKNLLCRFFTVVDIVEQDEKFIETAKLNLANNKVDQFICSGLQLFEPDTEYDVIWIQWVLNYLTDEDLVKLLRRCRSSLTPNGLLILKENCTKATVKNIVPDVDDSSITRPVPHFKKLFAEAGLRIVVHLKQKDFPRELFPVWTFALAPESSNANNANLKSDLDENISTDK